EVDVLADAAHAGMGNRRGDGEARVHAGDDVGDRDADLLRPAARELVALAGDAHEATHALEDEIVAGALGEGAVLPEAGDRAVDDERVELPDLIVPEAIPREVANLVVLDQDVAFGRERAHESLSGRLGEVDRDRLLAAVDGEVIGRLARFLPGRILEPGWPPAARVVAGPRPLDLDHLGAEVGEILRRPGSGEDAGEIENANV